jgi:hypothetical protein
MKVLSRYVDKTYSVLLIGKSALYLAGGLFLLAIAAMLAWAWIDSILLIIPALIGAKGGSLVLQALQPFAGKRPPPPAHGIGPRQMDRDRNLASPRKRSASRM